MRLLPRSIVASLGLVSLCVFCCFLTVARHQARGEIWMLGLFALLCWTPVIFISARWGFRVASAGVFLASLLLFIAAGGFWPTVWTLPVVTASFFVDQCVDPADDGTGALNRVRAAILGGAVGMSIVILGGFAFLMVPTKGEEILICHSGYSEANDREYSSETPRGQELLPGIKSVGGEDNGGTHLVFEIFTDQANIDRVVKRARSNPRVTQVLFGPSARCPL